MISIKYISLHRLLTAFVFADCASVHLYEGYSQIYCPFSRLKYKRPCGTIDIVPAPELCHLVIHIMIDIKLMVELNIGYLHLEGYECVTSYFAVYETLDLLKDSMIKYFQCIKTPIRNQTYLSDWNAMSVVFHRHAAKYPGYDMFPVTAVLAYYRGTPLKSNEDEKGESVVLVFPCF